MRKCPYCAEEVRGEAVLCRFCGSRLVRSSGPRDWERSRSDRKIAGVCGGLAEEFGVPTALVRLGFVLTTLFMGGIGIVLYVVLWVVMPEAAHPFDDARADELPRFVEDEVDRYRDV